MRSAAVWALGVGLAQASAGPACRLGAPPESDPRFKRFLHDSARTIAFLAHPTDAFQRASVDDGGLLTIEMRGNSNDAGRVLQVRVRLDAHDEVDRLWVERDTTPARPAPAFAGVDIIKGFVSARLQREEQAGSLSAEERRHVQGFRIALDTLEMDGRQIAEAFLRLHWRLARPAT